ncbi:hypothetical protein Hte_007800 [Hypoxylon texense]
MKLVIRKAPENYLNQPHPYIRTKEDGSGHKLFDQDDVDKGVVEAVGVLWKILVKTEYPRIMCAEFNFTIQETLRRSAASSLGCGRALNSRKSRAPAAGRNP